jgi:hypothetical protein
MRDVELPERVDHRAEAERHAALAAELLEKGYGPSAPFRGLAAHQQQAFLHLALAQAGEGGDGK